MNDRQEQRATIRLAARVYTLAAGVLGVIAGMGAFSVLASGPSIISVLTAIALLVAAAVVVITLLVAANLFLTIISIAEDLELQTHLLRRRHPPRQPPGLGSSPATPATVEHPHSPSTFNSDVDGDVAPSAGGG
jgi:hypothetical protein